MVEGHLRQAVGCHTETDARTKGTMLQSPWPCLDPRTGDHLHQQRNHHILYVRRQGGDVPGVHAPCAVSLPVRSNVDRHIPNHTLSINQGIARCIGLDVIEEHHASKHFKKIDGGPQNKQEHGKATEREQSAPIQVVRHHITWVTRHNGFNHSLSGPARREGVGSLIGGVNRNAQVYLQSDRFQTR